MNGTLKAMSTAAIRAAAHVPPACRIAQAPSGMQSQPASVNGIRADQLDSPNSFRLAAATYACSQGI